MLYRVARWIAVLVAALVVAFSGGLVWQVVIFERRGVLLVEPAQGLFPHVFLLGGLSALAWSIIVGAMLLPDVKWTCRRLAVRLHRPSEDVGDLAS